MTPFWTEMPATAITALLRFPGENLAQVLSTHEVELSAHDPYRDARFELQGQDVPLAANFTAGYGLWLARSGFNRQSLRSLFGREQGIDRPHLYLMQPYDPERRIISDGAVAITGDRIVAVGPTAEVEVAHPAGEVIDARGMAIMPGFFTLVRYSMKGIPPRSGTSTASNGMKIEIGRAHV